MPITPTNPFKGRQYPGEVILLAVRWYLRYPLAYLHVSELLTERGLFIDASCIWRWVQAYAPELDKRCRPHLKTTNKSYRVDETYIKVKGKDRYLYRAVDSTGQTIDFLLCRSRKSDYHRNSRQNGEQTQGWNAAGWRSLRRVDAVLATCLDSVGSERKKQNQSTAHDNADGRRSVQAARRSYRWCSPPTSGMAMTRPASGGWTGRGSGLSFSSAKWVRLRW